MTSTAESAPLDAEDATATSVWWPMAVAADVRRRAPKPLSASLHGIPWALAVMGGEIRALKDLCPHRRVPLSAGTVVDGEHGPMLECGYHGWAFGADGGCVAIPALGDSRVPKGMGGTPTLFVEERDGLVWATTDPDAGRGAVAAPGVQDPILLGPRTVNLPAAECLARLSGAAGAPAGFSRVIGVEKPLWFALRPVTDASTELFAVVPRDGSVGGGTTWLTRLAELEARRP